jgi:hypothetical protein
MMVGPVAFFPTGLSNGLGIRSSKELNGTDHVPRQR